MTVNAMDGIEEIAGEQMLLESENGALVLTTHRVRYEGASGGQREMMSILLPQVVSCAMRRVSHPMLLLFAASAVALALLTPNDDVRPVAFVVGALLVVAYFVFRTSQLSIASAGHRIEVEASGVSASEARQFINTLERAKARETGVANDP